MSAAVVAVTSSVAWVARVLVLASACVRTSWSDSDNFGGIGSLEIVKHFTMPVASKSTIFLRSFSPFTFQRSRTSVAYPGVCRPIGRATPQQADWRPPMGGPPRQSAVYRGEVWQYARVFLKAWRQSITTPPSCSSIVVCGITNRLELSTLVLRVTLAS